MNVSIKASIEYTVNEQHVMRSAEVSVSDIPQGVSSSLTPLVQVRQLLDEVFQKLVAKTEPTNATP